MEKLGFIENAYEMREHTQKTVSILEHGPKRRFLMHNWSYEQQPQKRLWNQGLCNRNGCIRLFPNDNKDIDKVSN